MEPAFTGIKRENRLPKKPRFKIALVTPAIFHNGWLPGSINPRTGEGNLKGVKVKLKGALRRTPHGHWRL